MENKDPSKHKYLQLANYIIKEIHDRNLKIGDQLPSVNQFSESLKISKSTVMAGLIYLSEKGIIESVYRKGYFIKSDHIENSFKVFFLMDQLTVFKEEIYSSFYNTVKSKALVDVFFHNYNDILFDKLILENINNYTHFVIIPNLKSDKSEILNQIPAKKRIVLDFNYDKLEGDYGLVYQDFQVDIFQALSQLQEQVAKYKRIILVSPKNAFYGKFVKSGVVKFCKKFDYEFDFIDGIKGYDIQVGDCFVTLNRNDKDDVDLIKFAQSERLELGRDLGLLSYNDYYYKEVLGGGISVISTDFHEMGKLAAEMILTNNFHKIRNKNILRIRNSL